MNDLNERLRIHGFRKRDDANEDGGCVVCDYRSLVDPDADASDDYCAYFHMRFRDDGYTCQQYKINHNISEFAGFLASNSNNKATSKGKEKKKSFFRRLFANE